VDPADLSPEWQHMPVHCIASRTDLDEPGASILATLLAKHGAGAEPVSWRSFSGAGLPQAEFKNARILCLSCLRSQFSGPRNVRKHPQFRESIIALMLTSQGDSRSFRDAMYRRALNNAAETSQTDSRKCAAP
jgi:hypothetical protein